MNLPTSRICAVHGEWPAEDCPDCRDDECLADSDNAALIAEWQALRALFEYVRTKTSTDAINYSELRELVAAVEAARK